MEGYDWTFHRCRKPAFDAAPQQHRFKAFDVDYIHLKGLQYGDLFVTRHGWPIVESLIPERWFVGQRFSRVGRALAGATGAVYRVPVSLPSRPDWALVAKFCRFGQDTLATRLDPTLIHALSENQSFSGAEFLSPFEEFGNLLLLRKTAGSSIRTQRPLAIYSPPTRYLEWELGRKSSLRDLHTHRLMENQSSDSDREPLDYDWERIYVLLYNWIDGVDAAQAGQAGLLNTPAVDSLACSARDRLLELGWVVLDHKPNHVIVRPSTERGGLIRRNAQPAWAIIDYELLLPCKVPIASALI